MTHIKIFVKKLKFSLVKKVDVYGAIMERKGVNENKVFILKSINDEDTLRKFFRIRYQVYVRMNYIETNKDRLDIDSWDLSSYFSHSSISVGFLCNNLNLQYKLKQAEMVHHIDF